MVRKLVLPLQRQMDRISYDFIDVEIPDFRSEFFDLWLGRLAGHYRVTIDQLAYIFVSDDYLLEMNRTHLDHDYYTDIITFNYNEENSLSGDVFISYDRVKANALEFGNGSVWDELCRVVVHGFLHLTGFNDKTDDESREMRKQEEICLSLR